MILIGSRALALRAPMALRRQPKDFDVICTRAEVDTWLSRWPSSDVSEPKPNKIVARGETNVEFEIITPGSSAELLDSMVDNSMVTPFGRVPSLDILFTIKQSHRYLKNSPHFWKNLGDWHILRGMGCQVNAPLLKMREKETYTYAHPKLNQGKASFFADDAIQYVYDHDSIHEAVKLQERPAYRYFNRDGAEVFSDKQKFFNQPLKIQLHSVVEESAVLAIERSLVPHPGKMTPTQAWQFALSKVCTSIASGWWRQFAYENALKVLTLYPVGYWERFQAALGEGVVLPFAA